MVSIAATSPEDYISQIEEPRKNQILQLHKLITTTVPELKPFIISGMIGYGSYHYKYASGREGDWCIVGLASQKNYISVYICAMKKGQYIAEQHKNELPKANIGKSCIRFKKVEDLDLDVLKKLLRLAAETQDHSM